MMPAAQPKTKPLFLRIFGLLLLSYALTTIIFHYAPLYRANYRHSIQSPWFSASAQTASAQTSTPPVFAPALNDNTTGAVLEEAAAWGVDSSFAIVIPALGATSNVISNVDPFDADQYQSVLLQGIAHAKGTSFPGYPGTIYLFSHSTDSLLNVARYNAVFYELRRLELGERIIIFFQDQKFEYQVTEKHVVPAEDTSWLSRHTEDRLILQTCDPPGTTFRRLLVIAKPL